MAAYSNSTYSSAPDGPRLVDLPDPVPILDEHLLKDESGREITYLDAKKLQRIADNNNRRVQRTGDESPVVVGHTQDGQPERDAPEIVGYARDFFVAPGQRVGHKILPAPRGTRGKHYLFTRWRVYEDKVDTLRKFPRRSVELWTSRWEVDPISLLGATTPDRDLGLVRMSDKGPSVRIVTPSEDDQPMFEDDQDQMPSEEDTQPLTLAQLRQTEEFQFLHELMAQVQQQGGPEDQGMPPEEGPMDPGMEGGEEEMPPEEDDQEPLRHAAIYGGSGNGTFTPSGDRRQMSRNDHSLKVRLARIEAQADSTAEENRKLRVQLARSKRQADLLELENEGIDLDVADELDVVAPEDGPLMDEKRYTAHLDKIRKRYRRDPAAASAGINFAQVGRVPRDKVRSGPDRQQAVKRAMARSKTVEDYEKNLDEELNGKAE